MLFDAAIQRWHSLQFCYGDHFKPTLGNFAKFSMLLLVPLTVYYQATFGAHHKEYNKMIARGEVAYNDASRRSKWFAN